MRDYTTKELIMELKGGIEPTTLLEVLERDNVYLTEEGLKLLVSWNKEWVQRDREVS